MKKLYEIEKVPIENELSEHKVFGSIEDLERWARYHKDLVDKYYDLEATVYEVSDEVYQKYFYNWDKVPRGDVKELGSLSLNLL